MWAECSAFLTGSGSLSAVNLKVDENYISNGKMIKPVHRQGG